MLVLLNALQAGNRSGTGRYTAELARCLPHACAKLDIDLVVAWPQEITRLDSGRPGPAQVLIRPAKSNARRLFYDQFGVRRDATRTGARLVHYPANIGNLIKMPKTVLTLHDLAFFRHPEWFPANRAAYYRWGAQRSVNLAHRVITVSQATADDLQELLGVSRERIDVIPEGVDKSFRPASQDAQRAARVKYRLPEAFLLYIGALEPRKNLVRAIRAWSHAAPTQPFDLVLAGRDAWKTQPIYDAARQSPYSNRIHFPGFIAPDDMAAVISAAHAFVWPSLREGFGLPPLEAMACGVPVLTSNTSSLPEVVGDAALLVDPFDEVAIAAGIEQIAGNADLRNRLREKGIERASQFTWERAARETAQSYQTALVM